MTRIVITLTLAMVAWSFHPRTAAAEPEEMPIPTAVRTMAEVQCNRAEACGNVGPSRLYQTMSACTADAVTRASAAFAVPTCPGSADAESVRECLTDIAGVDCGSLLADPAEMPSCQPESVCKP